MDLSNFAVNVGGVFVGAAISWGYLKAEVKNIKKDLILERETNRDQEEKINRLRDRGLDLVFKMNCTQLRDECRDRICDEFSEVKSEIKENRATLEKINSQVKEFMGYARATLEELRAN